MDYRECGPVSTVVRARYSIGRTFSVAVRLQSFAVLCVAVYQMIRASAYAHCAAALLVRAAAARGACAHAVAVGAVALCAIARGRFGWMEALCAGGGAPQTLWASLVVHAALAGDECAQRWFAALSLFLFVAAPAARVAVGRRQRAVFYRWDECLACDCGFSA